MPSQELLDHGEHDQAVLLAAKAVAFVGRDKVFNGTFELTQRHHDLIGFGFLHARIIGALNHEQRRFDVLRVEKRGLCLESYAVFRVVRIADTLEEHPARRSPVRRDGIEQRDDVRWPDDRHARGIELWCKRHSCERRVAAVGSAHDGNLLGVGDAALNEVFHAVGDVVLHHPGTPLFVSGIQKPLAEPGRAPKVRHQHRVAAVG